MSSSAKSSANEVRKAENTRIVAVIDIGATSVRMAVSQIDEDGTITNLESLSQAVSLLAEAKDKLADTYTSSEGTGTYVVDVSAVNCPGIGLGIRPIDLDTGNSFSISVEYTQFTVDIGTEGASSGGDGGDETEMMITGGGN